MWYFHTKKGELSKKAQNTEVQSQVYDDVQKRFNEPHAYSWCSLLAVNLIDIV